MELKPLRFQRNGGLKICDGNKQSGTLGSKKQRAAERRDECHRCSMVWGEKMEWISTRRKNRDDRNPKESPLSSFAKLPPSLMLALMVVSGSSQLPMIPAPRGLASFRRSVDGL